MKKFFVILSTLLMSLSLVSCKETPKEVQDEIDNYNEAVFGNASDLEYLPLSEVLNIADDTIKNNSSNIKIKDLILPDSHKMPIYRLDFDSSKCFDALKKVTSSDECKKGEDTYFAKLEGCDDISGNKRFFAEADLDMQLCYPNKEAVKKSEWGSYYDFDFCSNELGIITMFSDCETLESTSPLTLEAFKRYYRLSDDISDEYKMIDGNSYTIQEVINFAEKFCIDNFAESEFNQFSYKANYIDVRKLSDDSYGFYVSLSRIDSYGNYFDSTYAYHTELGNEKTPLLSAPIYLWIVGQSKIAELERHYSLKIVDENENDSFISLKSAVNTMSNKLAQGRAYDFDTVEFKYIFEFTESSYIDEANTYAETLDDYDKISVNLGTANIVKKGRYVLKAVPYWVFTKFSPTPMERNCGTIYMINAITGDFRNENENVHF